MGLRPFVRTVVYRGVFQHEGRPCLKMITDARSEKIGHLATHPHAEVAWYFTKSRCVRSVTEMSACRCLSLRCCCLDPLTVDRIATAHKHIHIHREQFRVFGRLQVVTHADTDKTLQGQRKLQWGCLSDNAKVGSFF